MKIETGISEYWMFGLQFMAKHHKDHSDRAMFIMMGKFFVVFQIQTKL